ncbi:MAG: hypothetical protein JWP01_1044 [Myxococcales bacterium]|nr:hypothetical protein [Myxococcales bacterium]
MGCAYAVRSRIGGWAHGTYAARDSGCCASSPPRVSPVRLNGAVRGSAEPARTSLAERGGRGAERLAITLPARDRDRGRELLSRTRSASHKRRPSRTPRLARSCVTTDVRSSRIDTTRSWRTDTTRSWRQQRTEAAFQQIARSVRQQPTRPIIRRAREHESSRAGRREDLIGPRGSARRRSRAHGCRSGLDGPPVLTHERARPRCPRSSIRLPSSVRASRTNPRIPGAATGTYAADRGRGRDVHVRP